MTDHNIGFHPYCPLLFKAEMASHSVQCNFGCNFGCTVQYVTQKGFMCDVGLTGDQ